MAINEQLMETLFTPVIEEGEQEARIVHKINFQKEEINKTETFIEKFQCCLTQQRNMLKYFCNKTIDTESKDNITKKIQIQKEEINKTEDLILQFQGCLKEQNNMLIQFCIKKNEIRNHIKELLNKITDDGQTDQNWLIYLNKLKADNKVLSSSVDKFIAKLTPDRVKDNLKRNNSEIVNEKIKKSKFNQKNIDDKSASILLNPDVKKHNLQLAKTFEEGVEISQFVHDEDYIVICGTNGFLLKYFINKNDYIKPYETNIKKPISHSIIYQDLIYVFSIDEMYCFDNRSKLNYFHFFNFRILNVSKRVKFILIFLENGSLLKFHFFDKKFTQIYWTKEILKKMFFLQSDYYLMLTKDEKVKILQGSSKINHLKNLTGTRDIREMKKQRTLFIKDKSIAIIDNMKHEVISTLNTNDCIQLVEILDDIGVILDEKNKLHIYSYKNYEFEKIDCLEFSVDYKITAIVITKPQDIYVAINNQIYKFCINE